MSTNIMPTEPSSEVKGLKETCDIIVASILNAPINQDVSSLQRLLEVYEDKLENLERELEACNPNPTY